MTYTGLYCEYFYYIRFFLTECALVQSVKSGRFMVYIPLKLIGFVKDSGGEQLLAEVPVVDFYSEYGFQKILQLTHRKLLREKLEGGR